SLKCKDVQFTTYSLKCLLLSDLKLCFSYIHYEIIEEVPISLNLEKHLILIKGEDKTRDIHSCEKQDGSWYIRFNKSNRVYTYLYENVVWYTNPKVYNPLKSIVYMGNQPVSGITSIIDF